MIIDLVSQFNMSLGLAGMMLCLMIIIQLIYEWRTAGANGRAPKQAGKPKWQAEKYYFLFFSCLFGLSLSNFAGLIMRGRPGPYYRTALYISNFLEFEFSDIVAYIASVYLLSLIETKKKLPAIRAGLISLLAGQTVMLIISQFTGWLYIIDSSNIYRRQPGYGAAYLVPGAFLVIGIVLLIRYGNYLMKRERTAFWMYLLAPIVAMVIQYFIYGVNLVVFATIFAGGVLRIFMTSAQTEKLRRQEQELNDLKVSLLLRQIQPHFIFNTLNTAYLLSVKDPAQANAVIRDFTVFLKSNISALANSGTITFEEELEPVKAYLSIMQKRYRQHFTVEYDIQENLSFRLPALTLQPIVENAVKYGVLQNESRDGQILIGACRTSDGYEVSVKDNGPGFDTSAVPAAAAGAGTSAAEVGTTAADKASEGNHIGMQNVRERLERLCGGALLVESAPGMGTKVTIRIPES